jgi:large subunit ribosomal protein L17
VRHRKKTLKLNRTSSHRTALLANLVSSLIREEAITTTVAKACAAQPLAEKMVTLAKRDTLATRRRAIQVLRDKDAAKKLFSEIGPRFADRVGGYTRLLKLARGRRGDGAPMARLSFLDEKESSSVTGTKKSGKITSPEKPKK